MIKENYILQEPAFGIYFLEINSSKGVLTNQKIRKALSLAFDRKYIISNITKMNQIPAGDFVPPNMNDYEGDFRENGGNYIDYNNYEENIKEAKLLMKEAGYENGKNFPVLDLLIATREFDINIADAVQSMLKEALNIDIRVMKHEWASYLQNMYDRNFDLAVYLWYADYNDPINFLNIFKSDAPNNYGAYSNNIFDEYINTVSTNKDNALRMKLMHEAEDIFINDNAILPIYFYSEPLLVSPRLKGVGYDSQGLYRFFNAYLE